MGATRTAGKCSLPRVLFLFRSRGSGGGERASSGAIRIRVPHSVTPVSASGNLLSPEDKTVSLHCAGMILAPFSETNSRSTKLICKRDERIFRKVDGT